MIGGRHERPRPPASIARLEKLLAALMARGIVTEAELVERQARTDRASPEIGARMVARAWLDPDWRAKLLANGAEAAEAMGVSMAGAPPLGVLEDKPEPAPPGGLRPVQLLPARRARLPAELVQELRVPLARHPRPARRAGGMGHHPAAGRQDPRRGQHRRLPLDGVAAAPAGAEGWSEDQLAALVTRDALVGVALPVLPVAAAAE